MCVLVDGAERGVSKTSREQNSTCNIKRRARGVGMSSRVKEMCNEEHVCYFCRRPCFCNTYTWACPWINDDEDRGCDKCLEKLAKEMEVYYYDEIPGS